MRCVPGPPAGGRAAGHDRPGGLRRFYPGPAGRAPERRGRADHPLAAECVLALAAARAPRRAAAVSGPGAPAAVAHLRHGAPGRRRALWRAADRVAGGDVSGPAPYPAPRVTGSSTDPHWHAQFEAWGMARRSRYEGPTGIASVMLDAARRRGMASLTLMGQAPHYLQGTTNPAMRQALLTYGRPPARPGARCLPSMPPCRPFGPAATRRWPRTPRPRPMYGNWSRPMTRRGTRRRAHPVTTTSTRRAIQAQGFLQGADRDQRTHPLSARYGGALPVATTSLGKAAKEEPKDFLRRSGSGTKRTKPLLRNGGKLTGAKN